MVNRIEHSSFGMLLLSANNQPTIDFHVLFVVSDLACFYTSWHLQLHFRHVTSRLSRPVTPKTKKVGDEPAANLPLQALIR
jgi:hypothetical protein